MTNTNRVGRYVKLTAQTGHGDRLADLMLRVANGLKDADGCELYVINRPLADPDAIWVTEVWRSQDDLDAALTAAGEGRSVAEVTSLLTGRPELIELQPLGGQGLTDLTGP